MKQSIDKCLAEYSDKELIQFHANINALFLCCSKDYHLFPVLMDIHFEIAKRNTDLTKRYLKAVEKMIAA